MPTIIYLYWVEFKSLGKLNNFCYWWIMSWYFAYFQLFFVKCGTSFRSKASFRLIVICISFQIWTMFMTDISSVWQIGNFCEHFRNQLEKYSVGWIRDVGCLWCRIIWCRLVMCDASGYQYQYQYQYQYKGKWCGWPHHWWRFRIECCTCPSCTTNVSTTCFFSFFNIRHPTSHTHPTHNNTTYILVQ